MKIFSTFLFSTLLFWISANNLLAQPSAQGNSTLPVSALNIEQGILHVKFKESHISNVKAGKMSSGMFGSKELDAVNSRIKAKKIKRVFREAGNFEEAHRKFGLHLWYEVQFDKTIDVNTAIEEYKKLDQFEKIQTRKAYWHSDPQANATVPTQQSPTATNDPLFSTQWHYKNTGQSGGKVGADIKLEQAWALQTGKPSVIVAVIDGGIDKTHPDLAASMWVNADEIPNNNIDDDHNGYIDDINGYDFADDRGAIHPHYHGMHVGGTIAAVNNNGIGVSGIAGGSNGGNGTRLMTLECFGISVGGFEEAMVYAADNGAVISQNSWGGGGTSIEDAIDYFKARAGLDNSVGNFNNNTQIGPMAGGIVIFAAGNDSSSDPNWGYPGSYPPVMAVAATNHLDKKAWFSNYGNWVEISAPGENVYSTHLNNSYQFLSGTSMACPHVSGVAALAIAQFGRPGYTNQMLWDKLLATTDNIDADNPTLIGKLGTGRLNAAKLLEPSDGIPPATIANLAVHKSGVTSITLNWTAPGGSGMTGAASVYDIRYSTTAINAGNFDQAIQYNAAPPPLASGSLETVEIKGLTHTTTYFFAIKAADYDNNWSAISNVATGNTLEPPVIGVSPSQFNVALNSGQQTTQYLHITNTGNTELEFSLSSKVSTTISSVSNTVSNLQSRRPIHSREMIEKRKQLIENRGKAIRNSESIKKSMTDTPPSTTAAGRVFQFNYDTNKIEELNSDNGNVLRAFPAPEFATGVDGLAYDGSHLYFITGWGTNHIFKINPLTGAVVEEKEIPGLSTVAGLGTDGQFLYCSSWEYGTIQVVDFNAGTILNTFTPSFPMGDGLTFAGNRGTLFVSAYNENDFHNIVYELNSQTGAVINNFQVEEYAYGLGYSNELSALLVDNFTRGGILFLNPDNGQEIRNVSTSFATALTADESASVIGIDPGIVLVPPGGSVDVPVLFDASFLNDDTYNYTITVSSNDPVRPSVLVPVTLSVTGTPFIFLPNTTLDFGNVFVGLNKNLSIEIQNKGTKELIISSFEFDNARFSTNQGTLTIPARGKQLVQITFQPDIQSDFTGILTLHSNDTDHAEVEINLHGQGLNRPVVSVNPLSYTEAVPVGEISQKALSIINTGIGDLNWQMSITQKTSLGDLLHNLKLNYSSITSAIPNRHNFTDGQIGSQINNGGENMFDKGNKVSFSNSTTSMTLTYYTNGEIANEPGMEGEYFTAKFPGLFVWAADGKLGTLQISGRLGANTSRNFSTNIFTINHGGKEFQAFVKRYYNGTTPSVNHMVVVEKKTGMTHVSSDGATYSHFVQGLGNIKTRAYYLMFGSANGAFVPDASIIEVITKFLNVVNPPQWISLSSTQGTTVGNATSSESVTFTATSIPAGHYQAEIKLENNDPANPTMILPVQVNVTAPPSIAVDQTNLDFGQIIVGASKQRYVILKNEGESPLVISEIKTQHNYFLPDPGSTTLSAGELKVLVVTYLPQQAGDDTAELEIVSNDPLKPSIFISLHASAVDNSLPIIISPTHISRTVEQGESVNASVVLDNSSGVSDVTWTAQLIEEQGNEWLTASTVSGELPAGETSEVDIQLNAQDLTPGHYIGRVTIAHSSGPSKDIIVLLEVTQPNRSPAASPIPDQELRMDEVVELNLDDFFTDEDGDVLSYQVSQGAFVETRMEGSVLTLEPIVLGETSLTILCDDNNGGTSEISFTVIVTSVTGLPGQEAESSFQNYPNPFVDKTTITYEVPREAHVQLSVYDVTGLLVKTLIDERQSSGSKEIQYEEKNISSGIYFYKLIIDGKNAGIGKMFKN